MAMNIIQLQDNLKNLSDQQLAQAMQMPAQDTPPFLVVSELNRRKKMRDNFQAQQASQNQTTVAQDVVAAAGVPQQAASEMAQSLAPQTDMTNNTGIMSIPQGAAPAQGMASGGVVKMFEGQTVLPQEGISEIDREPFTLADVLEQYGISIGLDNTTPGVRAVPGPGRPPIPTLETPPETPPVVAPGTPVDLAQLAEIAAAKKAADEKAAADKKGGSGGSGGAGGGKPSTYEQMLIDAKDNADKKFKQDKWMALAQMGLAMMSSQSPTLLGAIGEAGAASLPLYQQARDTADATKLEAAKGLYGIEQARAAAAAAAARANAPGKPKPIDVGALTALDGQIKELTSRSLIAEGAEKLEIAERLEVLQQQAQYILAAYLQQRGATGGITDVPIVTEDPEDSADLSTPQP